MRFRRVIHQHGSALADLERYELGIAESGTDVMFHLLDLKI